MQSNTTFTIGHSDHTARTFLRLLATAAIDAVIDVRSHPFSRRVPQFDKPELKNLLEASGIAYFFMGSKLGGRPRSDDLYKNGVADYEAMARTESFKEGVDQVVRASDRYRVALMCSEHDPLDCHRCLLIGRKIAELKHPVAHIIANGAIETHAEAERRLVRLEGFQGHDLFVGTSGRIELAYQRRAKRVAYHQPDQINDRRVASG